MENNKKILTFCALIGVLIFAYYFLPVNFVEGDDNVTVTATIGTTLTCNASAGSSDFGALTVAAITTSNPDITIDMTCNDPSGCVLSVKDVGDFSTTPCLHSTNTTDIIASADATLVAGTEGYGIQATSTTLTINPIYNKIGNDVGGLTIGGLDVSSSTGPISAETTIIKHKAAISATTQEANDYSDVLIYSCLGN